MKLMNLFYLPKDLKKWCSDVVVITTAQLHLTKPGIRLYAGSIPGRSMSEICDGPGWK